MYDLTTHEGVVTYLEESTSQEDWGNRCSQIKAANGGNYPDFWYVAVIQSGLANRTCGPDDLEINSKYHI